MIDWQSKASLETLRARDLLYQAIRAFFQSRLVMEVETPVISFAAPADPYIEPISLTESLTFSPLRLPYYLHASPEYAMKRLLAGGSGSIYQMTKAFRKEEIGAHHHFEFSMLEWYRVGMDLEAFRLEVQDLMAVLVPDKPFKIYPYRLLLKDYFGLDPFEDSDQAWERLATKLLGNLAESLNRMAILDLLMDECLRDSQWQNEILCVTDYPAGQSAMAVVEERAGYSVEKRFEIFGSGIEIVNAYEELRDAQVLEERLQSNQVIRLKQGKSSYPIDQAMLAAHQAGLPFCTGAAMGLDRLLMFKLGLKKLESVISFVQD